LLPESLPKQTTKMGPEEEWKYLKGEAAEIQVEGLGLWLSKHSHELGLISPHLRKWEGYHLLI
jgi:hypothetical protein